MAAAAVKCFDTTRALTGQERRGWLCISLACLAYLIAQSIWTFYELVLGIAEARTSKAEAAVFFKTRHVSRDSR